MVKYKTEAAEGGGLVEELSAQSRLDQETIRGLRDNIEELRQTAQTDKVCVVCVSLSRGGLGYNILIHSYLIYKSVNCDWNSSTVVC